MLASIRLCRIGKAEGINKYYANVLPDTYKLSSCVAWNSDDMPPVIVDALIGTIENLCTCSTSFMKKLCGIAYKGNYPGGSGVHQETYIKNLTGDVMKWYPLVRQTLTRIKQNLESVGCCFTHA